MSRYNLRRRPTREVSVGGVGIGGGNPVRLQSMTNTDTLDTRASAGQAVRIAEAGGELVRLTTQGKKQAAALEEVRAILDAHGCRLPLVADVHFNPDAALVAASVCEKVRINPGNFVDAARTFQKLEFTDEEYAAEISRIREALMPLLSVCRSHSTALRLGVNHGSLSDRIMSRYGDTPAGMVESVVEFLRICRKEDFNDIVISIKASNTQVMVETVRLLVEVMEKEGMDYPVHLGVTEAGDGEDGRIKSAVGIATLLNEGIGDTIRVSLSEAPEAEIPVARMLRDYICGREGHEPIEEPAVAVDMDSRGRSVAMPVDADVNGPLLAGFDFSMEGQAWHRADASARPEVYGDTLPVVLTSSHLNPPGEVMSWIDRFQLSGAENPVVVSLSYTDTDPEIVAVKAAADFGPLLLNGYCSAIEIKSPLPSEAEERIGLAIFQASRLRFSKPEYIACPGCGRTLFDLQATLQEVKQATSHLKGLKIGVMGCIVNGPGEMADADYGYVGAGRGRVSIYRGKELIHKNILREEALGAMISLIKADGRWHDPVEE